MSIVAIEILKRAVADLNADRPEDVPEVTKRRTFPTEKITESRMAVFLGDENVEPPRGSSNHDPLTRRRMALAVQCVGVTDNVEELDSTTELMQAWASQVLGQSKLGGLAHYVRETATQRVPIYQDLYVMLLTMIFEVSYQTVRTDQTRRI